MTRWPCKLKLLVLCDVLNIIAVANPVLNISGYQGKVIQIANIDWIMLKLQKRLFMALEAFNFL